MEIPHWTHDLIGLGQPFPLTVMPSISNRNTFTSGKQSPLETLLLVPPSCVHEAVKGQTSSPLFKCYLKKSHSWATRKTLKLRETKQVTTAAVNQEQHKYPSFNTLVFLFSSTITQPPAGASQIAFTEDWWWAVTPTVSHTNRPTETLCWNMTRTVLPPLRTTMWLYHFALFKDTSKRSSNSQAYAHYPCRVEHTLPEATIT